VDSQLEQNGNTSNVLRVEFGIDGPRFGKMWLGYEENRLNVRMKG